MRFNKRILLIFLVLVFASISCAAAADVANDVNQISNVDDVSIATTSDDSVDIDNNGINSINKDSDSSDDVVVEDGNNGADLRKSSTTTLYSNSAKSTTGTYNSNNNDFDTAYQNITQGKNATFKGKNVNITGSDSNYTIDASNNKVSITFNNCTGTVDNVHFKNFKLSAIRIVNGSSITFTNCNFTNNSPRTDQADMGGGAVYITGINGNKHSTGIFNNCNFANNLANARASGGAICIYNGGNGTFTNCNFTNNSARGFVFGGAVAVFSRSDRVSCSIFKNCIFKDNKVNSSTPSTHIGGGIYYSTNASNFSSDEICIDNCTFDNNYAKTTGGAVYLHRGGNYSVAKDFAINEKNDIEKYNDKGTNDIFKNSANVRTYASNDISTKFINNHDGVTDAYKANNQDKVHELVEQTHEDLGN